MDDDLRLQRHEDIKKGKTALLTLARLTVVLTIGIFILFQIIQHSNNSRTQAIAPLIATWEPPPGYELSTTSENIAYGYRFLDESEWHCGLAWNCIRAEIISSHDCPNGFNFEVVLLDNDGANIGSSIGTIGMITANEKAKLSLEIKKLSAQKIRAARASCQ